MNADHRNANHDAKRLDTVHKDSIERQNRHEDSCEKHKI